MILASVSVINERENYDALLECAVILNGKLVCHNVVRLEVGCLRDSQEREPGPCSSASATKARLCRLCHGPEKEQPV